MSTAANDQTTNSWAGVFERDWRAFWFSPTDPLPTAVLRIAVGAMAFLFVLSHTMDLVHWFGADGVLTIGVVQQLTGADQQAVYRPSYFFLLDNPIALWVLHAIGLAITALMTLGWKSRWTTPLSLAVVLSYVHRGPMITGPLEPALCFALFYLCFAPTGARLSLDARGRTEEETPTTNWTANFALRMLQVHVAALYLLMALTKLAGTTWWQGDAVWWLSAYTESRLIDLTGAIHRPFVFSALTHLVVTVELMMSTLIWYRAARPLLLIASATMWGLLALVTGLVAFCLLMVILNLAFAPNNWHRRLSLSSG